MKYLLFVIICLTLVLPLSAQLNSERSYALSDSRTSELRYHMLFEPGTPDTTQPAPLKNVKSVQIKKPGVGILLSAAVPGAGQIYAGSWKRGLIYLSLEAAMWIGYFSWKDEGEEWKDRFRDYADTHWSEDEWRAWMAQNPTFGDTTHTLPDTKTQQYYEMIGKYNQFKAGWDDWVEDGPDLTPNRDHYESMRDRSNRYLIRASYCTMIAFANHVISAFDAAFTVRRLNRRIETKMRVHMSNSPEQMMPVLVLHIRW